MSYTTKMGLKRITMVLVICAASLTWFRSGNAQGPCSVERGQDPLDVLNVGVRHNVWIVLDTSGSMDNSFPGSSSRLSAAKDVLTQLMTTELVDASGEPLVNWGYVNFDRNNDNGSACVDQFQSGCDGLKMSALIDPPDCGGADNRSDIINALQDTSANGWTPNGISLDQLSQDIVDQGFVSGLRSDQKNFIIIVTDGDDTCECDNTLWDGAPILGGNRARLRSRDAVPTPTEDLLDGLGQPSDSQVRAYNAGLKGRLAFDRLNPSPTDRASAEKGSVFVIGMGLNSSSMKRANHLAWEASGAYHNNTNAQSAMFANNQSELISRLRDAFAKIGIPHSDVILGSPVVGTVKELIPFTNPSLTKSDVVADISTPDYDDVRAARTNRAHHKDNILFTTSVETPDFKGHLKAFNIYKVLDPGQPTERREADFTQMWDAGVLLRDRDPEDRTILFNRRSETILREFTTNEVTAADLGVGAGYLSQIDGTGALTDIDAVEIVVKVIRGYRLSVDSTTGTIYRSDGELNFFKTDKDGNPTWKLLDPTNTGATVVLNPPRSPDFDPYMLHYDEYGTGQFPNGFYWEKINRQTMVYLGTNGGMMHGFRADNGAELFAYIPDDVLGLDTSFGEIMGSRDTLKDLVEILVAENNGIYNHKFFLAGSATVEDAFLQSPNGDDDWHTVIAFGRGRGGRFLTALDVTDIGDWDQNPVNIADRLDPVGNPSRMPKLLFNRGNREGIGDDLYEGLGETWSVPIIGNVSTTVGDQWVLFVGGGLGCTGSDQGEYFYVIQLEDGQVYKRFDLPNDDPNAVIDKNGLMATPALINPHRPGLNDGMDFVSRGYIGDLQGFVYKLDCSDPNPDDWTFETFFSLGLDQPITAPAAAYKDPFADRVFVFVGSGGDNRVVLDPGGFFKFAGIIDNDLDGSNTMGHSIQNLQGKDFLVELPQDERAFVAPVLAGMEDGAGTVFFASSRSELQPVSCTSKFYSSLFAYEATTGMGAYDLDPDQAGVQSELGLGEGKVTGLFHRDEHLYVSKSGGLDVAGEIQVRGSDEFPKPKSYNGVVQVDIENFRYSPF